MTGASYQSKDKVDGLTQQRRVVGSWCATTRNRMGLNPLVNVAVGMLMLSPVNVAQERRAKLRHR